MRSSLALAALTLLATPVIAGEVADEGWSASVDDERPPPTRGLSTDRLLVGIEVNRSDAGTLEVLRRGSSYGVPLEPFALLVNATLERAGGATRLLTPLGTVELEAGDLLEVEGTTYLTESAIEEKLATPVDFDAGSFALRFDLPWRPDRIDQLPPTTPPTPDARPPAVSLSTLRATATYTDRSGGDLYRSETTLGGRLAGGYWRLRWDDDLDGDGDGELRDYSWLRTAGRRRYLVGRQRSHLHPLLSSLEMTGVQMAYTNQPLSIFSRSPEPRELLSRRLRPLTELRGRGPAAGVAELRIDGEVVARRVIGLDGVYEFLDVPLDQRRLSRLEVYLYDRHNLSVPVAVHEKTASASDLLLADGAVIHLAGAGREGNLLGDPEPEEQGVGFYQWRYGLAERITLEASVQQGRDARQAVAGVVARLGSNTFATAAAGASEDGAGYDLSLESFRGPWRFLGQSRWLGEGYLAADAGESYSHDLELGWRRNGLDLALLGRSARAAEDRDEYLLPAVAWRPSHRLYLRARPDRGGDYRYDLAYYFGAGRVGVSYQDRFSSNLTWRFRERYYLTVDSQLGDGRPDRHSAIVSWYGNGRWRPYWSLGALYTDGGGTGDDGDGVGYLAAVTAEVTSGLRLRLEVENPTGDSDDTQLFVGLTADLAFARGRLVSARRAAVRDDRGGIAGGVRIEGPWGPAGGDLRGLDVFLDGRLATHTESGGGFFIGDLEPGLYRVELDPENLPLGLDPRRTSFVAEVAAAAVTRVGFVVEPEYGLAGRLTDAAGDPVAEAWVEIVDAGGELHDTARTDRFGLYRFDGLPPGSYTLRVAERSFPDADFELPSRRVEVRDDFLFGQDLRMPSPSRGRSAHPPRPPRERGGGRQ